MKLSSDHDRKQTQQVTAPVTSKQTLEVRITQAWQRQAWWLWLLLPLSWLYALVAWVRCRLYASGRLAVYRAPVPVLVVGNITVGGSGKTPLIISLVQHLQGKSVKVGVISRGYGGDSRIMPLLVQADSSPKQVGDEPCLIVQATGVPMAVAGNRQDAIECLLATHSDIELIISDDGLQHYALARDIEWIVVDGERGFGNRQLLPVGYLREPMTRLRQYQKDTSAGLVICHQRDLSQLLGGGSDGISQDKNHNYNYSHNHNHSHSHLGSYWMQLQSQSLEAIFITSQYQHLYEQCHLALADCTHAGINAQQTPSTEQPVDALTGIGYPPRFFASLRALGYDVIEHPVADHHDFVLQDFAIFLQQGRAGLPLIITSKDAVKIRQLFMQTMPNLPADQQHKYLDLLQRMWVLPVTAQLSAACYQALAEQLNRVGVVYPANHQNASNDRQSD